MDRTDSEECVQLVWTPHRENGDGVGPPTSLHHTKGFSVKVVQSVCGKPSSSIVDHVQEWYLKRHMAEFNDNPSQVAFPSQRTVKKKTDNRNERQRQILDTEAKFEDPRLSEMYTLNVGCTED
jgi:hypothetical protein